LSRVFLVKIYCRSTILLLVKAKFHYAIQVAELVIDPVSDQVSVKFLRHVKIARTSLQTGSQLAFDQLLTSLRHAHDTHTQVCVQVGDLVCDWIA